MAKRVNTVFLLALTLVVVVMGVVGFGFYKYMHRPNAQKHVAAAKQYLQDNNYEGAWIEYTLATRLDRTNKALYIDLGDVANRRGGELGWGALEQARAAWQGALEIDPHDPVALNRLLDSYIDQISYAPSSMQPAQYASLKDIAGRLYQDDSSNVRAHSYLLIAPLEQWLQGGPLSQKALADLLGDLGKIQKAHPENYEVLSTLCRARLRDAVDAIRGSNPARADEDLKQIHPVLDAALAVHPMTASLMLRIAQVDRLLAQFGKTREERQKQLDTSDAALQEAQKLATDSDPLMVEVYLESANRAVEHQKVAEAESLLRKVDATPRGSSDVRVRTELARVLGMTGDSAKRQEAIKMLSTPLVDSHEAGVRGALLKFNESTMLEELCYLRIDQYGVTTDSQQRNQLLVQIDDGYKSLASQFRTESPQLLRLRASVERIKGQKAQSIETLKRAVDIMDHMPNKPQFQYDLIFQLARGYFEANLNRAAEQRLVQVLQVAPTFMPARTMLFELYVQERNFAAAQNQIDQLSAVLPNSPDAARYQIALAQAQGKSQEDLKGLYEKLPEDTLSARRFKAERAYAIENYPDAARLFEAVLKEEPRDVRSVLLLSNVYSKLDQKDKAKALVASSITSMPDEPRLKILQQQLDGATPEQLKALSQKLLASGDPTSQELAAARSDAAQGKYDSALAHLKKVREQRPDDVAAWDLTFHIDLGQGRFDQAQVAADNLARMNADQDNGRAYAWELAMAQRDFAKAVSIGRQLTSDRSAFSQSWRMLGDALRAAGQLNEALNQYRTALEIQSTNVDACIGEVRCLEGLDQPDQARDVASAGLQRMPDNAALKEIVMSHDALHNAADVVPQRREILEKAPNDPMSYYNLAETAMMAAKQAETADPVKARQFSDEADQTLRKGVAKFPDDLRLNAGLAEVLEKTGHFDDGLKILERISALPQNKDRPEIISLMGEYYTRGDHPEDAEKYFRQAWAASHDDTAMELRLAQHLVGEKRYDAALEVLADKTNADRLEVIRARVRTLMAAGRFDEADKNARTALDANPKSEDLMLLLAGIELTSKNYPAARQHAQAALAIDPKNDTAIYFQALVEINDLKDGNIAQAIQNLGDLVTRHPKVIHYKVDLSTAYARRNDEEAAAHQLEDALTIDPTDDDVRARLLTIYLQGQKWGRFEEVVQQAEKDPKLSSNPAWPHADAQALAQQKNYSKALEQMQQAIKLDKTHNILYQHDLLDIMLASGDDKGVLSQTDALLADNHRDYWIYSDRGIAHAATGDKSTASSDFDQALKAIDPDKDFDAARDVILKMGQSVGYDQAIARVQPHVATENRWRMLAVDLHIASSDWAGAVEMLEPLLAKPDALAADVRISVLQKAGVAFQMAGQFDKARKAYEDLLKIHPNDISVLNNIAYLLAVDMKSPVQAKTYSQQAYDSQIRNGLVNPGVADTHGWVLTLCGGNDAGIGLTILDGIVRDHPEFLEARYHLGMAYLRKKDSKMAEQQLAAAMSQVQQMENQHQAVDAHLKDEINQGLRQAREQNGTSVGSAR